MTDESLRNPMGVGSLRKRLAAIGMAVGIATSGPVGGISADKPPVEGENQATSSTIVSQGEIPRPFPPADSITPLASESTITSTSKQSAAATSTSITGQNPIEAPEPTLGSTPESALATPTRTPEPLPTPKSTSPPASQTTPEQSGTMPPPYEETPHQIPDAFPAPTSGIGTGVEATPIPPPEDRQELERLINGEHPQVSMEQLLNDIEAVYSSSLKAEQIWAQQYAIHDAQVTGKDQQAALETLAYNLNEIYVKIKSPLSYNAVKSAIDRTIDLFRASGKQGLLRLFQIRSDK